jgi:glycosyltransferase involved in cell wall biosynthesis
MSTQIEISAIIPVLRDDSDVEGTFARYKASLARLGRPVELVYVLDGEQPRTLAALKGLRCRGESIEILNFPRTMGESAALSAGFRHARGDIIVTLPVVPTVEPDELPRLVAALDGCDMVVARRSDPSLPPEPKFERLLRLLLKSPFHDIRSDVRVMRAQVAGELTLYGTQHRFLPLLAMAEGFTAKEVDVKPAGRLLARGPVPDLGLVLDTLALFFLLKFLRKPFRFFGGVGFVVLAVGGIATAWLVFVRLVFGIGLADRPALILSSLLVVLGIQIIAVGLIGEIITFAYAREIKDYKIERIVD